MGSPASAVSPEFIANMGALIRRLASDEPARRVPSATECRFCDIGREDCPVRIRGRLRSPRERPATSSNRCPVSHRYLIPAGLHTRGLTTEEGRYLID